MSRPWNPDYPLTQEQAGLLIEQQFPALVPARLQPLGIGWDNAAYLVNERYVFRFPRRKMAAELIEVECRVLPSLAPGLTLPIPVPTFVSTPTETYPPVFAGYAFLPGKTACQYDWTEDERAENAQALAAFLASLHQVPVSAETLSNGPKDSIQRANIKMRAGRLIERLQQTPDFDFPVDTLIRIVEELAATPPHTGPLCWVHGDLYARHLLMDGRKTLCGVIDWGDVHLGDPALDLSIALSFLPPSSHPHFRQAYGKADEAAWNRARFRALHYGVILTDYGTEIGDGAIRKVGEQALLHVVSGGFSSLKR